jgi:hypothetical protein
MGLDIVAYSRVELVGVGIDNEEFADQENLCAAYATDFPEQIDVLLEGMYKVEGDSHCFHAGSCGSYGDWRKQLANMIGTTAEKIWADPTQKLPFVELIWFADNEGTIGPHTSMKLHKDFVDNLDKAKEFSVTLPFEGAAYFMELYNDFLKAFELASDCGFVKFT